MESPLGYVVDNMIQKPVREHFSNPDSMEELQMIAIPGAVSNSSHSILKDYFASNESVVEIVEVLLEEPFVKRTYKGTPQYLEYAELYHAQNTVCSTNFTAGILQTIFDKTFPKARDVILRKLNLFQPLGCMNVEVLCRVFHTTLEKHCTLSGIMDSFEEKANQFIYGLFFQIGRECMKEFMLKLCDELDTFSEYWSSIPYLLLQQLFPKTPLNVPEQCSHYNNPIFQKVVSNAEVYKFTLMIYTCDLLTDLIQENRENTLGRFIVKAICNNIEMANIIVDNALHDLRTIPNTFTCESYGLKVLNSLLQLHHCGCITFGQDPPETLSSGNYNIGPTCLGTLNPLWKAVLIRLPEILAVLTVSPNKAVQLKHVQMLYLLYPILRVSCCAVDYQLIQSQTMVKILHLLQRYPRANIMHSAVCRLYITCMEDNPIMFGREVENSSRTIHDSLRLSVVEQGMDSVIDACVANKIPCFKDIAMSFDEFMQLKPSVSTAVQEKWDEFSGSTLSAVHTAWESTWVLPEDRVVVRKNSLLESRINTNMLLSKANEVEDSSQPMHSQGSVAPINLKLCATDLLKSFKNDIVESTDQTPHEDTQQKAPIRIAEAVEQTAVKPNSFNEPLCENDASLQSELSRPQFTSSPITKNGSGSIGASDFDMISCSSSTKLSPDIPTPLNALYDDEDRNIIAAVSIKAKPSSIHA